MNIVCCLQAPKGVGGSKTQYGLFSCKIALYLKKVYYNFLCVNTVSDKVVRNSLAYISVQKLFAGGEWGASRTT